LDARAINAMSADVARLHARLNEWARWSRDEAQERTNHRHILDKLIEQGPSAGAGNDPRAPTTIPDRVFSVERAIAKLPKADQTAIREMYLHERSFEAVARVLRVNITTFRTHTMKRIRWRLIGYIDAMDDMLRTARHK
jgi:DNA-directed RNA polymerase specialized sigma24 family protein